MKKKTSGTSNPEHAVPLPASVTPASQDEMQPSVAMPSETGSMANEAADLFAAACAKEGPKETSLLECCAPTNTVDITNAPSTEPLLPLLSFLPPVAPYQPESNTPMEMPKTTYLRRLLPRPPAHTPDQTGCSAVKSGEATEPCVPAPSPVHTHNQLEFNPAEQKGTAGPLSPDRQLLCQFIPTDLLPLIPAAPPVQPRCTPVKSGETISPHLPTPPPVYTPDQSPLIPEKPKRPLVFHSYTYPPPKRPRCNSKGPETAPSRVSAPSASTLTDRRPPPKRPKCNSKGPETAPSRVSAPSTSTLTDRRPPPKRPRCNSKGPETAPSRVSATSTPIFTYNPPHIIKKPSLSLLFGSLIAQKSPESQTQLEQPEPRLLKFSSPEI